MAWSRAAVPLNRRMSRSVGVSSVTISDPVANSIFIVNMPIEVSGTAAGSGAIYATFDGGPSRGTGTASSGTFTIDVTALAADIASPAELQIRRTVDDVVIGTLACSVVQAALWAPTNTVLGTPVTTSASVPADLSTWPDNLEVTVGGGNAVKATTAESRHYVYVADPTNDIASYCDIDVSACVAQGSQVWVRVWAGTAWCNVNLSTGAQGNKSGATVTCTAGVVAFRSVLARDCRVELLEPALGDDATATPAIYVGNVADGFTGDVTFDQTRLQTDTDKSGTGANLTNGTAATQLLYQATFASLAGLLVAMKERGRGAFAESTNATLLAAVNGLDTPYLACGIVKLDGSLAAGIDPRVPYWLNGGLCIPLYRAGVNNWASYRNGVTYQYPGVTDAMILGAWHTWAVRFNGDGTRKAELYLDGVLVSTTAALASATITTTSFAVGVNAVIDAEIDIADHLVLAGTPPTYAAMRAAMKAMCKPYNDSVPGSLTF
jgi:hypothetical protein